MGGRGANALHVSPARPPRAFSAGPADRVCGVFISERGEKGMKTSIPMDRVQAPCHPRLPRGRGAAARGHLRCLTLASPLLSALRPSADAEVASHWFLVPKAQEMHFLPLGVELSHQSRRWLQGHPPAQTRVRNKRHWPRGLLFEGEIMVKIIFLSGGFMAFYPVPGLTTAPRQLLLEDVGATVMKQATELFPGCV